MKNHIEPYQAMSWEAPIWLRTAIACNELPSDTEEDDPSFSDETVSSDEHSLGFV